MTKDDINRLFDLLAIYRPGDKHLKDKTLRSAWALVLEPYEPADVKAAVAAYFREKRFWPDVTDIAIRCPKPVDVGGVSSNAGAFAEDKAVGAFRARWNELRLRRTEAGLPAGFEKAKAASLTADMWFDQLEAAGLAL